MKYLNKFAFVVLFACSVVISAQDQPSLVKPGTAYKQNAVKFRSPKQTGWTLKKSEKEETLLEKAATVEVLFASVKTIKTKHFDEERELLSHLESMKRDELLSNHVRDSLHFNYVTYKETPCVQYDGVFNFKEEAKSTYKFFNFKGYLCRHTKNPDLVIQMEFSNHSNVRSFTEDFNLTSSRFFEQTEFTKGSAK